MTVDDVFAYEKAWRLVGNQTEQPAICSDDCEAVDELGGES